MEQLVFLVMAIIVGIVVCKSFKKQRWLITFLISSGLISAIKILTELGINNNPTSDRITALVGEAIGFGLIAGSIGFWIGSSIFKLNKKSQGNSTNDEKTKPRTSALTNEELNLSKNNLLNSNSVISAFFEKDNYTVSDALQLKMFTDNNGTITLYNHHIKRNLGKKLLITVLVAAVFALTGYVLRMPYLVITPIAIAIIYSGNFVLNTVEKYKFIPRKEMITTYNILGISIEDYKFDNMEVELLSQNMQENSVELICFGDDDIPSIGYVNNNTDYRLLVEHFEKIFIKSKF